MKFISGLLQKCKTFHIAFVMAVIFINIVIAPYSDYHLQKEVKNSNDSKPLMLNYASNHKPWKSYENVYPNIKLNMSRETQDAIYSDIIQTIKAMEKSSPIENSKTSNAEEQIDSRKINDNHKKDRTRIKTDQSRTSNFLANIFLEIKPSLDQTVRISKIVRGNEPAEDIEKRLISADDENDHFSENELEKVSPSEYLLGYSSNVFGSHNKYIENMNYSKEVPRYLEPLEIEKPINETIHLRRKKRSVIHLYNMVLCATGCDPLTYKGYGCYCGFLGSGYVVDGIDRCCQMHDWCYDTAGCPMFLEYFIPYQWKCYHRRPLCAIDHGEYGGPGSCAQRLCECDRQLAQCLRRYPCPSTKAICTSSPWRLLQNIFML